MGLLRFILGHICGHHACCSIEQLQDRSLAHVAGTPHYMPVEIWMNRPYGTPADVWAVGCLLYELMTYKCAA